MHKKLTEEIKQLKEQKVIQQSGYALETDGHTSCSISACDAVFKKCIDVQKWYSKGDNGCKALRLSWGPGTNDCHVCASTDRKYAPYDRDECHALCEDLYDFFRD